MAEPVYRQSLFSYSFIPKFYASRHELFQAPHGTRLPGMHGRALDEQRDPAFVPQCDNEPGDSRYSGTVQKFQLPDIKRYRVRRRDLLNRSIQEISDLPISVITS
jgi:hypothetical protein